MSFDPLILAQSLESGVPLPGGLKKAFEGQESLIYYAICGIFFVLCGLTCGYFIWRKGQLDAELEIKRTENELEAAKEDLHLEEREIGSGEPTRAS